MNKYLSLLLVIVLLNVSNYGLSQVATDSLNVYLEEIEEEDPVYQVVEIMPYHKGCYLVENENLQNICERILSVYMIYHKLRLPDGGFEPKMQVVQFIIEKDSSLSNINVVRKIRDDIDSHSIELIQEISAAKEFCPGFQSEELVRVLYTYPIICKHHKDYDFNQVNLNYGEDGENFEENFDGNIYFDGDFISLEEVKDIEVRVGVSVNVSKWVYGKEPLEIELSLINY